MSNQISEALDVLITSAREAHEAPDAAPGDFTFRLRPDGSGVDCFRNWQGVVLAFNTEKE